MIDLAKETAILVEEMAVLVKYYESRLSSNVARNNGAFDYQDGSTMGFYYKYPVSYRLMRTGINFRNLKERAGALLQGGCSLTIPRKTRNHHAVVTSRKAITTLDLSTDKNIKVQVDGGTATEIDCSQGASDTSAVTLYEIIEAINNAGLGEIAYESGKDGDPIGSGYLSIRSLSAGTSSKLNIINPTTGNAIQDILGLIEGLDTYYYVPSRSVDQFLNLYPTVSRGDVFVIDNRERREGEILKKGVNDTLSSFDVTRILSISKEATVYKRGVDYQLSGLSITWLSGGASPATNEDYTVEYLCKTNYIVFDELAADRGSDLDEPAKRIHLALRQFTNPQPLSID